MTHTLFHVICISAPTLWGSWKVSSYSRSLNSLMAELEFQLRLSYPKSKVLNLHLHFLKESVGGA